MSRSEQHSADNASDSEREDQLDVQDDQVIGTAFKWSAGILAALLILAGVGLGIQYALKPAPEKVLEEGRADLDKLLQGPAEVDLPEFAFTDITTSAGIDFVHRNGASGERLLPETMGGGVGWLDYDNDGAVDLLLVDSGPWSGDTEANWPGALRLYRNLGDGKFSEVSRKVGLADVQSYGMGLAIADYDGDGDQDIFLTALGLNRLFNNQGGRFVEVSEEAGVAGEANRWSSSAGFFDFDRDGWLDLFVVNYVDWSRERDFDVDYRLDGIGRAYGPPTNFPGTQNYLYRNLGNGQFVEVGTEMGLHVLQADGQSPVGKGLALLTEDLDGDGWQDVVVANDTVRNFMFRNRGPEGGFEEVGETWGLGYDRNGTATGAMGIDAGNVLDDGATAIAIGNFANEMTSFYVSQGAGMPYSDEAIVSGIGPGSRMALSFGVLFVDLDLDGRLDFVQANGHVEDEINLVQSSQHYAQPAQLFWNCGSSCAASMIEVPAEQRGALADPIVGRGLASADFDGDGDLDLILTQINGAPKLLRNDTGGKGHWLQLQLKGQGGNLDALGARVTLVAGGRTQSRTVSRNRSYLSQVDPTLNFGLGDAERVDRIDIVWPDGSKQSIEGIAVNQRRQVIQSEKLDPSQATNEKTPQGAFQRTNATLQPAERPMVRQSAPLYVAI